MQVTLHFTDFDFAQAVEYVFASQLTPLEKMRLSRNYVKVEQSGPYY